MPILKSIGAAVRTVLEAGNDGPVGLSSLRIAVKSRLDEGGVEHDGLADNTGFLDLIRTLSNYAWVVPVGSDWLVVPAGRPEAIVNGKIRYRLRPDIFKAFATFGTKETSYIPETDRMVRTKGVEPGTKAVRVKSTTMEFELDLRREFIHDLPAGEHRSALDATLKEDRPFAAFSKELHRSPFVASWNTFRFGRIYSRIWYWVESNGLQWHPAWLVASVPPPPPLPKPISARPMSARLPAEDDRTENGVSVQVSAEDPPELPTAPERASADGRPSPDGMEGPPPEDSPEAPILLSAVELDPTLVEDPPATETLLAADHDNKAGGPQEVSPQDSGKSLGKVSEEDSRATVHPDNGWLIGALARLTPSDLARISIPADLVLKMLDRGR